MSIKGKTAPARAIISGQRKAGTAMDFKHLEFFVTVAQCRSINKAAQELYISQPHLSHIIRDMEADVGSPLLIRSKQGVSLTPAGQQFLDHAQVILREMENLRQFSHHARQEKDRLSVSMTKFSHTMESFNDVCARNQGQHRFTYSLREGTVIDVINDVAESGANVGVIHYAIQQKSRIQAQMQEKHLSLRPIAVLSPHIVISKNHELIRQGRPVTLENLSDYGFVRYLGQYEDFIYHISTQTSQRDLNSSPKIAYVYGRAALLHLISISDFYTIGIPGFQTQDSMYQIISMPIPDSTELLEFAVVTRRDGELTDTEQEFIRDVVERYRNVQEAERRGC